MSPWLEAEAEEEAKEAVEVKDKVVEVKDKVVEEEWQPKVDMATEVDKEVAEEAEAAEAWVARHSRCKPKPIKTSTRSLLLNNSNNLPTLTCNNKEAEVDKEVVVLTLCHKKMQELLTQEEEEEVVLAAEVEEVERDKTVQSHGEIQIPFTKMLLRKSTEICSKTEPSGTSRNTESTCLASALLLRSWAWLTSTVQR